MKLNLNRKITCQWLWRILDSVIRRFKKIGKSKCSKTSQLLWASHVCFIFSGYFNWSK